MAIWEAKHCEDEARVVLLKKTPVKNCKLNQWRYAGDAEFYYRAETERQAREALIERLDRLVRAYENIIAVEKSRLA